MVKEIRFGSDRHLMLNYEVFKCKLGGFVVAVKTASQKIKIKDLIQINVIFVHGIQWSTFTEIVREIGEGRKFALSAVTRTAS